MSSPVFPLESQGRNALVLPLAKRLLLGFLAFCIQMIYIPASNQVSGGIEPRLSLDVFPIWPVWVLPYVSCYLLWCSCFAWVIFKTDPEQFRAFVTACMLTFGIGAMTFLFFPTYVKSASIPGDDMFTALLRIFHEQTGRYAALPSGHVYITTLLALFFSRWFPRSRLMWILVLVVVSLSTLFTGQHYILDVLGGYLAALAGYYFGLWWVGRFPAAKQVLKPPRKRMTSSSLN